MRLWRLASWISLRHLRDQAGRTAVSVLGIALGVSTFVAIRLASGSAVAAFNESVNVLAGQANLQVLGHSHGVEEERLAQALRLDGVQQMWPVIETLASNPALPGQSVLVLGLDFYTDPRIANLAMSEGASGQRPEPEDLLRFLVAPDSLAVTRSLADRNGWKLGQRVQLSASGRRVDLTVRLLLPEGGLSRAYGGDVAIMDIAAAQESLDRLGRLDRVDFVVRPEHLETVRDKLAELYPAAEVSTPAGRGERVESMMASFRLNLLALALVALFVGAFLIFNSVSLSVIQRRREIGMARSVGVSRPQILGLFLGEAALYGVVGSAVGLALGVWLARMALGSVSETVANMYASVQATEIVVDPATLAWGFALGMAAALLSGLAPALEATSTAPGVVSREGSLMQSRRRTLVVLTWLAAATAAAAVALAYLALHVSSGVAGFASAALLMVASALAAPVLTVGLAKLAALPVHWLGGVEGHISARWVVQSLERTSVVIAALAATVTMLIALNMMVGSFRHTVEVWMDQTVRADLFIEPASRRTTGAMSDLPVGVLEVMRELPGTREIDSLRNSSTRADGHEVEIFAFDLGKLRDYSTLIFLSGDANQQINQALENEQVLVSETFMATTGKDRGDTVTLSTPAGPREFEIAGVFYDYTTEGGLIVMHRQLYARVWNDPGINTAIIYVKEGADPAEVRRDLLRRVSGRYDISVLPNRALKDRALEVFDQTFAITNALKVVALVIAVLGVVTTMAALILQRRREIGVLRAVGASRAQIARMAVLESGLIGVFGAISGALCGPAVALVLIRVINRLFFGWTIIPTVEARWFLEAAAWIVAASLLAGLVPAQFASRMQPAEAVRDET